MFYEEKVIGGVLMCRGLPGGVWTPVSPERMTERLVKAESRPIGPSDEDKRDAARYRWLRDNEDIYCGGRVRGVFWIRDDLDAAIDKEMDKSSPLATSGRE